MIKNEIYSGEYSFKITISNKYNFILNLQVWDFFVFFVRFWSLWFAFTHYSMIFQSQTDAIIGWVDKAGRPFLMDTWIVGRTAPKLDENQDVLNLKGKTEDGFTTLSFDRKRDTGDTTQVCTETTNKQYILICKQLLVNHENYRINI